MSRTKKPALPGHLLASADQLAKNVKADLILILADGAINRRALESLSQEAQILLVTSNPRFLLDTESLGIWRIHYPNTRRSYFARGHQYPHCISNVAGRLCDLGRIDTEFLGSRGASSYARLGIHGSRRARLLARRMVDFYHARTSCPPDRDVLEPFWRLVKGYARPAIKATRIVDSLPTQCARGHLTTLLGIG